MESSRVAAKQALNDTLGRLEKLVPNRTLVDEKLTLNAVTPHPQVFETTFGREVSVLEGLCRDHKLNSPPSMSYRWSYPFKTHASVPFSYGSVNCTRSIIGPW